MAKELKNAPPEKCERCGKETTGNSTMVVFHDQIVCASCFTQLTEQENPKPVKVPYYTSMLLYGKYLFYMGLVISGFGLATIVLTMGYSFIYSFCIFIAGAIIAVCGQVVVAFRDIARNSYHIRNGLSRPNHG